MDYTYRLKKTMASLNDQSMSAIARFLVQDWLTHSN